MAELKCWTIRICRKCGGHHGRSHDGCVTHSSPMFPQVTEHAGVDEIEVVAVRELIEVLRATRHRPLLTAATFIERELGSLSPNVR